MTLLTETHSPSTARIYVRRCGLRPQETKASYVVGLLAALAIHGSLIFFWPKPHALEKTVEFDVEAGDASVEVSLVAALPAEEEQPKETPPDPTPPPPPPEQKEEPPPPPPEKAPEMTIPEPPPKPPEPERPKQQQAPQLPKQKPKPVAPRAVGDGSSKIPGNDATTAKAASGAISAKPAYLRNPHPAYPEEARAAKQQGVVTLRVNVDASGHVVSVRLVQSSGFPILDERARSTVAEKWVFKPATNGGAAVASEVVIPIRFTLEH
ncbi:MAG TPA: energy transducer TonB [Chthoniobacter sp.]|nr:energy transducer TonB [Chthoniobacter sp.]